MTAAALTPGSFLLGQVTFLPLVLASNNFGVSPAAGGWLSQDQYPRLPGDVNGDGRADIVGFGFPGTYTALAQASGTFAAPVLASTIFGASPAAGGWVSQDQNPRLLGDVNGDGRADLVGFGLGGPLPRSANSMGLSRRRSLARAYSARARRRAAGRARTKTREFWVM